MLFWLGLQLEPVFGPFRLLSSRLFLIAAGTAVSFALTFVLTPRSYRWLPTDRGRGFAVDGHAAKGKPTGAGVVFITVFCLVALLVVPFGWRQLAILVLTYVSMLAGYLDDRSEKPWSEYRKGLLDLIVSVAAAFLLYGPSRLLWFPFTSVHVSVSMAVFIPLATILIWASINSTNCTDGVDGLSSTLVLLALLSIGAFLYVIVGNQEISAYLLLPFYREAANSAILVFTMVGALAGYLWYNAHPSAVLMGDAGSRALGFLIGVGIIMTGNPFMILLSSAVILVNGGTGLLKVALLRFAKIRILHSIRFPLHDHFRHTRNWSNTQVLVRFALIQILIIIATFGLFIKIR
ncbi:MAG: phospho-N-acetylmuramoyl-pentapeptide-transferase [Spirochaetaceae bacterium]|nr:MAG: phospho-N-acetylmuramoyl-pentapeptide-transferase [Spirochaetaceae bacterium]